MSPLLWVVNVAVSALVGWFYLGGFYYYAQGTIYASYFVWCAVGCAILMFLWAPQKGEENSLMLFGFDTGVTVKPGTYILANLAPFLREINLHLGYSITRLQEGKKITGENVDIKINRDQRKTEYSARVTTTSFFALDFNKAYHAVWAFLTEFEDKHGQIQYYKVGRTAFLVLLLVTAIAKVTHPSSVQVTPPSKPSFTPSQQSETTPLFGHKAEVDVLLKKSAQPVMPDEGKFRMPPNQGNTVYSFFIDGRKYIAYTEPPIGKIRGLAITESVCPLIPWGKEVIFFTKYPPQYASNVVDSVSYVKKEFSYSYLEQLRVALRKFASGHTLIIDKAASWEDLYDNWDEVEGESPGIKVKARYQKNDEDPQIGGAIVCF